ncbi:MAG: PilX N-terminal domain-containing pilus assembly protein [Dokdonella sp.]
MRTMSFQPGLRHNQKGAVLFVALIFLILLTLLALTATGSSILQEKMTGGMRNRQLGLMGAESALRGGEANLWTLNFTAAGGQPMPPCISGVTHSCVYRPQRNGSLDPKIQAFRSAKTWQFKDSGGSSVALPLAGSPTYTQTLTGLTGAAETASLSAQPYLTIEDLGADVAAGAGGQSGVIDPERQGGPGTAWLYRITSRSQGGSAAVVRVAESVFSSANLTNTGIDAGP